MVAVAAVLRGPTANDERVWSGVFRTGSRQRVYAPLQVIVGGAIVDALFLKSCCGHFPNLLRCEIIIPRVTDTHLICRVARVNAAGVD